MLLKSENGVLISGVQGLPDIDRGNRERLAGQLDAAQHDLLPLALRGYPDAEVYLAATYAARDTVAAERESMRWYRAALTERPNAGIALAGVLTETRNLGDAREALDLIRQQESLHNELAPAALLNLYTADPFLDVKNTAATLVIAAAQSKIPNDRLAALDWYRANLAVGNSAQRLQALCPDNLAISPNCYVDLALFLRYQGKQAELKALVTQALLSFQKGMPPPDPNELYRSPIALPKIAADLAAAMVSQPQAGPINQAYANFEDQIEYKADVLADAGDDADIAQVDPVATAIASEDAHAPPANASLDQADRILRWMLKQPGDFPAQAAAVAVRVPYLLQDVDLVGLLEPAAAAGQASAQLALGELYYYGQRAPLDPERAERNLLASDAHRSVKVDTDHDLCKLYEKGLLGLPDTQKAVDYCLASARGGKAEVYSDLARMFTSAPGFRVNRAYAYVFARRADDAGYPVVLRMRVIPRNSPVDAPKPAPGERPGVDVAYKLIDRLKAELSDQERAHSDTLYEAECSLRPVLRKPLPTDIYARKPS